jgi:membrane peptidoglycan carboxypeptidase
MVWGGFQWLAGDLPSPDSLPEMFQTPSVRITDRYGRLLYEAISETGGRHTVVPLEHIPLDLRQATIATEDRSFYEHPGVDFTGILRALWINLRQGETLAGGSTITQQVARNLLLSEDERSQRSLRRKLREMILAWQLTRRYSKDEILEIYLNQIYYGGNAYGVEAAAQTFFGKPVKELDLAECAGGIAPGAGVLQSFHRERGSTGAPEDCIRFDGSGWLDNARTAPDGGARAAYLR